MKYLSHVLQIGPGRSELQTPGGPDARFAAPVGLAAEQANDEINRA
jgi:hypothetical protein